MSGYATSRWTTILQWFYCLCVGVAVVPMGAVHDPVIAVVGFLFAGLSFLCAFSPLRTELQATMAAGAAVFGALVLGALAQTTAVGPAHPAWAAASEALGPLGPSGGAVTVSVHATLTGLSSLLVPGMALLSGIVLFQDDDGARRLLWFAALLGLAGALLGVYEFAAAPGDLLFQPRRHPMDGVTAFFVNRNTAATFLGMGAVAWLALLAPRVAPLGISGLRNLFVDTGIGSRREAMALIGLLLGLLAMLVALFLTKSRAGITASLAGMFVTLIATLPSGRGGDGVPTRRPAVIASAAFVVAVVMLYGSQYLTRVTQSDAVNDGRWCFFGGMLAAVRDWPLTGTGFATVRNVYPAYQDPQCFGTEYVLDRGHNGYLEIAMGMGVGSLVVIAVGVGILVVTLAGGIKARRRIRYLPAAALGVTVIGALHSAVDFSLQIPGVATYAGSIIAAGLIAARPEANRRRVRRKRTLAIA